MELFWTTMTSEIESRFPTNMLDCMKTSKKNLGYYSRDYFYGSKLLVNQLLITLWSGLLVVRVLLRFFLWHTTSSLTRISLIRLHKSWKVKQYCPSTSFILNVTLYSSLDWLNSGLKTLLSVHTMSKPFVLFILWRHN